MNEQMNDESVLLNPGYFVAHVAQLQKSVVASDLFLASPLR